MHKKKINIWVLVLLLLLTALVIIGTYVGIRNYKPREEKPPTITLSNVQAYIASRDGKEHTLQATVSLNADEWKSQSIDRWALREKMQEILSGLDYDRVSGYNGMQYIKDELTANLTDFFEPEEITSIYFSEIMGDIKLTPVNKEAERQDEVFKGIFKGAR